MLLTSRECAVCLYVPRCFAASSRGSSARLPLVLRVTHCGNVPVDVTARSAEQRFQVAYDVAPPGPRARGARNQARTSLR